MTWFQVKFSVPTMQYPVAQVTVDIYFSVEIKHKSVHPIFIDVSQITEIS